MYYRKSKNNITNIFISISRLSFFYDKKIFESLINDLMLTRIKLNFRKKKKYSFKFKVKKIYLSIEKPFAILKVFYKWSEYQSF